MVQERSPEWVAEMIAFMGGVQRRAGEGRRVGRGPWAGRSGHGQDGQPGRRAGGGDRRAVRRGQGVAGRLLGGRGQGRGAGGRAGRRRWSSGPAGWSCVRCRTGRPSSDRRTSLLRELAPQVLGVLVRRYGQFDAAEDAVQEALLAAALQWPAEGVPDNPRSWLIAVAARRLVDEFRSESAAGAREETVARAGPPSRRRPATTGRHADPAVPVLPSRRCPRRRSSR